MSDLLDGPAIAGPRYPSWNGPHAGTPAGSTVELDDTPGARVPGIPTEWLHESEPGRLLLRRQARLFVASRLLAAAPGVLSDTVRRLGTLTQVRPTDAARAMARAAVLLADELIRINDEVPHPLPPAPAAALAADDGREDAA